MKKNFLFRALFIFILISTFFPLAAKARKKSRNIDSKSRISISSGFFQIDGFDSEPNAMLSYQRSIFAAWFFSANFAISRLGVGQMEKFINSALGYSFHDDESLVLFYDFSAGYKLAQAEKYSIATVFGLGMLRADGRYFYSGHLGFLIDREISKSMTIFIESRLYLSRMSIFRTRISSSTTDQALTDSEESISTYWGYNSLFNLGFALNF